MMLQVLLFVSPFFIKYLFTLHHDCTILIGQRIGTRSKEHMVQFGLLCLNIRLRKFSFSAVLFLPILSEFCPFVFVLVIVYKRINNLFCYYKYIVVFYHIGIVD